MQIILNPLKDDDISKVIDRCLDRANATRKRPVTIDEEAREMLIKLSEGYPHFIQQYGYSAYEFNSDDNICINDVMMGAVGSPGRRGALEEIGDRYYRDDFYNKIQKESYREVLRIMAAKSDNWISKGEIGEEFTGKASILSSAIRALRGGAILFLVRKDREGYIDYNKRDLLCGSKLLLTKKNHGHHLADLAAEFLLKIILCTTTPLRGALFGPTRWGI